MTLTLPRVTVFALILTLGLSSGAKATPFQCYDAYNGGNYGSAYQLCLTEAGNGDATSQANLGLMYLNGLGVAPSVEQAVAWLRKSADQGNATGQAYLGVMYQTGRGTAKSVEQAVAWYRKSADQGNATGQAYLAYMLENGKGTAQDREQAILLYQKAAAQGYDGAKAALTRLGVPLAPVVPVVTQATLPTLNGFGVAQSNEQAVVLLRKAADQGNADAQAILGDMYFKGRGVAQSFEQALVWYRKAADQGNANGQVNLGLIYSNGLGVPQSFEQAVPWYRKAADQGNADAQANLGVMYETGRGVPQSDEIAVVWLRKAADQGNADAQAYLADMLENGKVTAKNVEQAIVLYQKAAAQGNDYAKKALTRLSASLAPVVPVGKVTTLTVLSPDRLGAVSGSSVTLHLQVDNPQQLALRFVVLVSKGRSSRIQGLSFTSSSSDLNLTVPIPSSLNLKNGERFTVTLEGFTPSGDKLPVKSLELTYWKAAPPVGPIPPTHKKLALVIGNKNYLSHPLDNPLNDARDMKAVLENLGFDVMYGTNLDTQKMKNLISAFGGKLRQQGGLGLFYFSGHGVTVKGEGYLVPINNIFQDEVAIQTDAINLKEVLTAMTRPLSSANSLNIVILDACRSQPAGFQSSVKSLKGDEAGGLSRLGNYVTANTYVAYATQAGKVADDGKGQGNSPFTIALKKYLADSSLYANDVFYQLRQSVLTSTRGAQEPSFEGALPTFRFSQ